MTAARPAATTRAAVLAASSLVALLVGGCRGPSGAEPAAGSAGGTLTSADVQALLDTRAAAVLQHDAATLAATTAVSASTSVRDLGMRVQSLRLTTWEWDVQSVRGGPGPGAATARVLLRYRLSVDPGTASAASALRTVVVARVDGAPRVVSDVPVGAQLPWDLGRVLPTASTSAEVLDVRARPDGRDDAALLGAASAAARAVTAVWGSGWRGAPVVVATDRAGLAALTGRDAASVAGLVAVSTVDRVYVDVAAWSALSPAGRQVLLTHEVTHVATRSATDRHVPLWLAEGFADYVALLHAGLSVRTVAAPLLDAVRAGAAAPAALPSDADFTAAATVQARAYAGAWLACRAVADSRGTAGLVAVYRATSAGTRPDAGADVDSALREVTGSGLAFWTQRWRTEVLRASTGASSGRLAP